MHLWFPSAIEAIRPDYRRQAEHDVDMDLAARLAPAIYAYPMFLGILALTTSVYRDHPTVLWSLTWTTLICAACRAGMLLLLKKWYAWNPNTWRWTVSLSVIVSAFTAGLVVAALNYYYGLSSWIYTLAILWLSGCTSGAICALVPNGGLHKMHLLSHLTPAILAAWLFGGSSGHAVAFAYGVLMFSAYLQGRRLEQAYWQQTVQRWRDKDRSRELEAAHQAAEQANRAQASFIANMSHEIRTPLNGVIGMLNLSLESQIDSERHEFLRTGLVSAEYLLQLINEILDFSKIEAGKLVIEWGDRMSGTWCGKPSLCFGFRRNTKASTCLMRLTRRCPPWCGETVCGFARFW